MKTIEELEKENERLKHELKCWGKMLELYGINDEKMSAALSFSFNDGDSSYNYMNGMLSLDEHDLKWFKETHGMTLTNATKGV